MATKYSYSRMETYDKCKFKYKLKYEDKHYVGGASIALNFGTLVHDTEERIANAIMAGEPINYITLKNNFIKELAKINYLFPVDYFELDKSNRTYFQKAYEYLESGIYRLENFLKANPHIKLVGAEKEFNCTIHDRTFYGKIDRIMQDTTTGKYIIQDIKTYAVPMDDKDLVTPLQFVVYVTAWCNQTGCSENDIICQYDLPLCDTVHNAGTSGFIQRGLKKLGKLFDGIVDKDFEPNPSPLCHWCEFCPTNKNQPEGGKNLCPYYSYWTKDNPSFRIACTWQGLEKHQEILENFYGIKC